MTTFIFLNAPDLSAGFREGQKGTHTSRTIMLAELRRVLSTNLASDALAKAIIHENVLEKSTTSGRILTLQRLKELYGLDDAIPLYRVLRSLFSREPHALPILALLASLARDPLLRATVKPVVGLAQGQNSCEMLSEAPYQRQSAHVSMRPHSKKWSGTPRARGRNPSSCRKDFQRRSHVSTSPAAMAFAVWLAQAAGFKGDKILSSGWVGILDLVPTERAAMLERARAAGLVHVRQVGSHQEIDASHLSASRG